MTSAYDMGVTLPPISSSLIFLVKSMNDLNHKLVYDMRVTLKSFYLFLYSFKLTEF